MSVASLGVKALIGFGLLGMATQPVWAANCPGNPDAIGTSRTIVVDPREHPRIGTMQYPETLPLEDHEVVLTFDDGPIPKHSNEILAILADQCVKATFFEIGRMAQEHPEGVRKLIAAGHSVGTHTQNHPLTMNRLPIAAAQKEIDDGITSVTAALGDPALLSPFMRIPGLLRAGAVEDYLASQGIQAWSADFPADDWRHVTSKTVHDLAISRIKAKGKGILLLHDIQPRTAAALPGILADLKAGGFRIVHVVAATADLPKTPTDLQQWQMHPTSAKVAISHWQKVPSFAYANLDMLPAPAMSASDQTLSFPESFGRGRGAVVQSAPWPRPSTLQAMTGGTTLPVPAQNLFEIAERHGEPIKAMVRLPHHAEAQAGPEGASRLISIDASAARRAIPGSMPVTRPGMQPGPLLLR
ncbi:MAG: polysaccharide deacetylase [Tardiphaga sp.]|jgi:peptidoglycan/xylan/chitin deacetylase (PgdA/CDA1 family)|nr:polysaccharide deacetylase [Tardiphaga sp.]